LKKRKTSWRQSRNKRRALTGLDHNVTFDIQVEASSRPPKRQRKSEDVEDESESEEEEAKEEAEKKREVGEAYYLQVPPGKLGLSVKFLHYTRSPQPGAVITAILETCAIKGQVEVGDRIVLINGYQAVTKLEDLSIGNDQVRIIGFVKGG
jgi:hypothetical protein